MRKKFIFIQFILFYSLLSIAQISEGIFLFDKNGKVTSQDSAYKKIEVTKVMDKTFVVANHRYLNSENPHIDDNYTEIRTTFNDSIFYIKKAYEAGCGDPNYMDKKECKAIVTKKDTIFYVRIYSPNNELLTEGNSIYYYPFYWHGTIREYNNKGVVKTEKEYFLNEILSKKRFNSKGKVIKDIIWPNKSLEEYTEPFIKDTSLTIEQEILRLITKNNYLHYPDEARENCIMGRVYLSYIVTNTGSIESIQTVIGVHPLIDKASEEAILKVSQMIDSITPGTVNGVPVNMEKIIKISFFVYCFGEETNISTEGGNVKQIKDIKPNDIILSFSDEKIVKQKVIQVIESKHSNILELSFKEGKILVTDDHPFLREDNKWASISPDISNAFYKQSQEVKRLKIGDKVYMPLKNNYSELLKIKKMVDSQVMYTLILEKGNSFIANGFCVKTEVISKLK